MRTEPQLHPQPDLPVALASASCTQQASTPAGAGPPQQPVAALAATACTGVAAAAGAATQQLVAVDWAASSSANCVMQTPVSGSTSSTRLAASQSPAIAATTDRTCS